MHELHVYVVKIAFICWAVVMHTFNPSTQEAEVGGSLELKASLVYIVLG